MKRTRYGCCPPKKKKCKRPSQNRKLGLVMLLLGLLTAMALLMPLKGWIVLLCAGRRAVFGRRKKGCHPNDLKSLMRQPLVCEVLRWHG